MPTSNNKGLNLATSKLFSKSIINFNKGRKRIKRKFPDYARSLLPFANWIGNYQFRWIVGDIVAGLTVGIMLVPQALAYSKLTGLSSEYALYSSLIGGIVYTFLGTCREISLGPTAIVCLVLGQYIQEVKSQTNFTGPEIASVFCIVCSLISLFLGVFRLGFLLELVSNPIILGFTTGAAFKVILSQLPGLLGIPNVNNNQLTYLIISNLFYNINDLSWINFILGLSSLIFLLTLNFITNRFKNYTIIQYISITTIGLTVIIFTIIAYLLKLNFTNIKMNLVGNIPSGIKFTLPSTDISLWLKVFKLSIPLTLILLMEILVISKTFSKIGGYSVNISQELVALGMVNLIGTYFSAFPVTGSLSRCAVLSKTGVKSPLSGIFTGIVVILAVIVLTPVFKFIPLPTLAAIIIIAVSKLIMKWEELTNLLKNDKFDFFLCLFCSILTFFLGTDLGIYISVILSFLILIFKMAYPKLLILYRVLGENEHFEDRKNTYFESENPESGIIIFRPKESLLFPNIEYFKEAMMNVVLEETSSLAAPISIEDKPWCDDLLTKGERLRVLRSRKTGLPKVSYSDLPSLKAVIMDLTCVNIIDGSGIQGLRDFKEQCEAHSGLKASKNPVCRKNEIINNSSTDNIQFKMLFVTTSYELIEKLKISSLISSKQSNIPQRDDINICSTDCYYNIGSVLKSL